MILEAITYPGDFPVSITVGNIREYPIHYHKDLELVYVLEGSVLLRNGYCTYELQAGDIFANAGHEVHTLQAASGDNITALIHVSNLFFTQFYPNLPLGCYRTYSSGQTNRHLPELRLSLLKLLTCYLQKDINYQDSCISICLSVINQLNKYFNLFAFRDNIVVHFDSGDPVIEERISHVINYVYEHHDTRITLADLAAMEHLSTSYLSHLIKDYLGISFRDFLSFDRAEWSEIYLLGSDQKISRIASLVGFSAVKYYEETFSRWFGHSPEEHRRLYGGWILTDDNPPSIEELPIHRTLDVLNRSQSRLISQNRSLRQAARREFRSEVSLETPVIRPFHRSVTVLVTLDDFRVLQHRVYDYLRRLSCQDPVILLLPEEKKSPELAEWERRTRKRGFSMTREKRFEPPAGGRYGFDSVAGLAALYNSGIHSDAENLRLMLRDQDTQDASLKGQRSILLSDGTPKPLLFGLELLTENAGELVLEDENCGVIRLSSDGTAWLVLAFNANRNVLGLSESSCTPYYADQTLSGFNDELNLSLTFRIPAGDYLVSKYTSSSYNSLFSVMSRMGFPEKMGARYNVHPEVYSNPVADTYMEKADSHLDLELQFRGIGVQTVLIQKIR